jgi:hypothetical protein
MAKQLIVPTAAALICAACAGEPVAKPYALGASVYGMAPAAAAAPTDPEIRAALKKTMASKVLAAIALERVTGRKPDPGRLTVSN